VVPKLPARVVVDEANVYWVDRKRGAVFKAPKGGGASVALVSHLPDPLRWVELQQDERFLYLGLVSLGAQLLQIWKGGSQRQQRVVESRYEGFPFTVGLGQVLWEDAGTLVGSVSGKNLDPAVRIRDLERADSESAWAWTDLCGLAADANEVA